MYPVSLCGPAAKAACHEQFRKIAGVAGWQATGPELEESPNDFDGDLSYACKPPPATRSR
jgi:hypothetical protein